MTKIELFPYQKKFVSDIQNAFKTNKHVIGLGVCGFGKSYCLSDIAMKTVNKGGKVLILSHRLVLLRQNNESLSEYGLENMVVINDESANMSYNDSLYCSSLQTLQSRMKSDEFCEFIKTFKLIIIDESHTLHSLFLFESGLVDDIFMLGMSGSPKRSGNQRQIGIDWDIIVESLSVKDLIDLGRLVPCRYFLTPMDISEMKVDNKTGDFQSKSVYQAFDTPKKYSGAIKQYKKHGENRQFIIFNANIAHTIKTTVEFNNAGIKTAYVISNISKPKKPNEDNPAALIRYEDHLETYNLHLKYNKYCIKQTDVKMALSSGVIQGVACINILNTGFDYKPLSCLIYNKSTQSLPTYVQTIGRVQRCANGKKDAIVLDFGGNVSRLGKIEDPIKFSLWHEMNDGGNSIVIVKECGENNKPDKNGNKGCHRLILASASICPKCGKIQTTPKELRDIELVEVLQEEPKSLTEMSVQGLVAYAELHSYKRAWVFRQLYVRGESEFRKGMRELNYDNRFIYRTLEQYKKPRKTKKK